MDTTTDHVTALTLSARNGWRLAAYLTDSRLVELVARAVPMLDREGGPASTPEDLREAWANLDGRTACAWVETASFRLLACSLVHALRGVDVTVGEGSTWAIRDGLRAVRAVCKAAAGRGTMGADVLRYAYEAARSALGKAETAPTLGGPRVPWGHLAAWGAWASACSGVRAAWDDSDREPINPSEAAGYGLAGGRVDLDAVAWELSDDAAWATIDTAREWDGGDAETVARVAARAAWELAADEWPARAFDVAAQAAERGGDVERGAAVVAELRAARDRRAAWLRGLREDLAKARATLAPELLARLREDLAGRGPRAGCRATLRDVREALADALASAWQPSPERLRSLPCGYGDAWADGREADREEAAELADACAYLRAAR